MNKTKISKEITDIIEASSDLILNLEDESKVSYSKPKLNINFFDPQEISDLKSSIDNIKLTIRENSLSSPDEIYRHPQLDLEKIPKEEYDSLLQDVRRNNYGGQGPEAGYAYVAAGVVAVIGAKKVHSIVSKKFTSGVSFPDNGYPGNGTPFPDIQDPSVPIAGSPTPSLPGPGWTDPLPPTFDQEIFDRVQPILIDRYLKRGIND
ncbi:MAG: hypothetical protein OFPII_05930 [Osedax symbiont Rs1]|nr:MAG: hypothetical protein OFPII_05930 [Osedax symbiont Rs1]